MYQSVSVIKLINIDIRLIVIRIYLTLSQQHEFFKGLDWAALYACKLTPPIDIGLHKKTVPTTTAPNSTALTTNNITNNLNTTNATTQSVHSDADDTLRPDRTTSTTPNPPEINSTVVYDFDDWTQHFHEGFTNQNISLSIIEDTYSNNTYNNNTTQNDNNDNNTCISSRNNSQNYDTSRKGQNYDPLDNNDEELYKDFEYINKPILVSKEKLQQLELEFQKKSIKIQKKKKLKSKKLSITNNNIILNKQSLENKSEEIQLKLIYTENMKIINEYKQKCQNYDQQVNNIQNEINANRKLVKGIHKKLKDIQLLQDKLNSDTNTNNSSTTANSNTNNNHSITTTSTASTTNASKNATNKSSKATTPRTTPTTTPTAPPPPPILTPEQIEKLNQKAPLTKRLIELELVYTQLLTTQSALIPPSPLSPELQRLLDEEKAKDSGAPLHTIIPTTKITPVENKSGTCSNVSNTVNAISANNYNNTCPIQSKSEVVAAVASSSCTNYNSCSSSALNAVKEHAHTSAPPPTSAAKDSVWGKSLPSSLNNTTLSTPHTAAPTTSLAPSLTPLTSYVSVKKAPLPLNSEPIVANRGDQNKAAKPENGCSGGDDDWQPIISARSNKKKINKI